MNLQLARYSNRLRKLLVLRGVDPTPELSPEVQPVMIVEGDRWENLFLGGERLWGFADTPAAAGAANFYHYFLHMPVGSRAIAVVTYVRFNVAAADNLFIYEMDWTIVVGLIQSATRRDSRVSGGSFVQLNRNISPAIGGAIFPLHALNNATVLEYTQPIVIAPGRGVMVANRSVVAQASGAISWAWYERTAEVGEA